MGIADVPQVWWSWDNGKLLAQFRSTNLGLSLEEARHRLKMIGPNELAKKESVPVLLRLVRKLLNPLIMLLLIAGFLSAVLGQVSDFIIISVITLISVALDTYQEHVAEEAAEKLRKSVSLTATVLHDHEKKEVDFAHVVPGDVVFLSAGDIVPADGKLLTSEHLMIDQSTLTGESYPQHKKFEEKVSTKAQLSERVNCCFMGTHVVSGEGTMLVVATANTTELGKIAHSLVGAREKTEFEKGLSGYGFLLMRILFILAPVMFLAHIFLAHNILESLLFVLALAVGFAPELLPLIVTINLSKGALRMSKKGVIVKYLPAIENFGSMDVLCTDKTGTLTENVIKLVSYEDSTGKSVEDVFMYCYLVSYFQTAMKNPLEDAVLVKKQEHAIPYKKLYELPFDFYRKRMSVVLTHRGTSTLITKGAPESVLSQCNTVKEDGKIKVLSEETKQQLHERLTALATDGYRVIAVAYKDIEEAKKYKTTDEAGLTFVGFLSFIDPPKHSVRPAVQLLEERGVEIKILTGDSELVTKKVCEELHIPIEGILLGNDIDRLDDGALSHVVDTTTIFARLNPESKKRVIAALRVRGHVVGFLGDGVNDAPALREGDIGISVNNAVDIAKESADLILLHKDLHVLADGVYEGRKTFANVMKYIKMGTSSNFGNMVSVAIASLFLPFLPMLPTQILLNDLLYDFSQLLLANDNVDHEAIAKPKKWDIKAIRHFMVIFGPISSFFDLTTFGILLWFFHASPALFQTGWFLESLATQTLVIFSIRTVVVPFFRSRPNSLFALGLWGIVAVALLIPLSPLGAMFGFVAPPGPYYPALIGIVGTYLVLVECTKLWFYSRYDL
jgi:Mg2+-importing ATPase